VPLLGPRGNAALVEYNVGTIRKGQTKDKGQRSDKVATKPIQPDYPYQPGPYKIIELMFMLNVDAGADVDDRGNL